MTFGDPERLLQVFRNVLTNAIKYTPDGGCVTVDGRKLPGFIEIIVRDTGIGIDPEDQSIIFEKFTRLGNISLHSSGKTKFKGGGPGLGLHIARGIIEAHGGAIWVESPGMTKRRCPAPPSTSCCRCGARRPIHAWRACFRRLLNNPIVEENVEMTSTDKTEIFIYPAADRIASFKPYFFAQLNQSIAALKAKGVDIIRLDMGSPDLPPADFIIDTLVDEARKPEYARLYPHGRHAGFQESLRRILPAALWGRAGSAKRSAGADWFERRPVQPEPGAAQPR